MKHTILMYFIILITVALSFAAPETGKLAPDFSLPDYKGKMHSLQEFKGKWTVLEWVNYDCPFVKKFYNSGEMQKLQKEYTQKGVAWVSICSSAVGKQGHFTQKEIEKRMNEHGVHINAYLVDEKGDVGRLYEAKTTPHIFIINPDGILVYMGAIDSIRSTKSEDIAKAENYVRTTLDNAMNGKPVPASSTNTISSLI